MWKWAGLAALALGGAAWAEEPAREAVLAALIAESGLQMAGAPDCEAGYTAQPVATLGEDIAEHLALVTDGGVVSVECRSPEATGRLCTVGVGRNAGDDVWTRFYRFTLGPDGRMVGGTLFCTTVP